MKAIRKRNIFLGRFLFASQVSMLICAPIIVFILGLLKIGDSAIMRGAALSLMTFGCAMLLSIYLGDKKGEVVVGTAT